MKKNQEHQIAQIKLLLKFHALENMQWTLLLNIHLFRIVYIRNRNKK
jgi:hypothetical protein